MSFILLRRTLLDKAQAEERLDFGLVSNNERFDLALASNIFT